MAGYNTCKHGFCRDCGYWNGEHHPECDAADTGGPHECPECSKEGAMNELQAACDKAKADLAKTEEYMSKFMALSNKLHAALVDGAPLVELNNLRNQMRDLRKEYGR